MQPMIGSPVSKTRSSGLATRGLQTRYSTRALLPWLSGTAAVASILDSSLFSDITNFVSNLFRGGWPNQVHALSLRCAGGRRGACSPRGACSCPHACAR